MNIQSDARTLTGHWDLPRLWLYSHGPPLLGTDGLRGRQPLHFGDGCGNATPGGICSRKAELRRLTSWRHDSLEAGAPALRPHPYNARAKQLT
ncbi:protein of unknown function [Blastococcus saxobsidens DD2]|uniref:Uncharacterized protein n=1 Tax=Blastococcus saxobsidens (strain DD2) TaxID=1146883 RepID=H6RU75_BLASD|nr:protein of unknown function [Blastococcus saxobsidens DD2]